MFKKVFFKKEKKRIIYQAIKQKVVHMSYNIPIGYSDGWCVYKVIGFKDPLTVTTSNGRHSFFNCVPWTYKEMKI